MSRQLPTMAFSSAQSLGDKVYTAVPTPLQGAARLTVARAYRWCSSNFPLADRPKSDLGWRPAITQIDIRTTPEGQLLSASSAQAPGRLILGAPWPLKDFYRLGSLMAHEIVHQGLFLREAVDTPVRHGSLAYSPWRQTARPGRLVWHAFWTFTCQLAISIHALQHTPELFNDDQSIARFLAQIIPRLEICRDSLERFDVVTGAERRNCNRAHEIVSGLGLGRSTRYGLANVVAEEKSKAEADYEAWAGTVVVKA